MGLHSFLIMLDNTTGTFVSHKDTTLITGRVVIVMGKSKQVEGLKLQFKGKAKVVWSEQHGKHSVTYVGREKFFSQTFRLVGDAGEGMREKVLLASGEHSYPFCFTLPPNLPSSCKELHGTIKYTIEAVVERSWKTNFNTKRRLEVVAPLDLLTSLELMTPIKYTDEKNFCCLWCRSGPLTLVVGVPSRGIVVGREFAVTVEADNTSSYDVLQVVGKIKKYTVVRLAPPRTRSHFTKKTICTFEFGSVLRKSSMSKTVILPPLTEPAINVDVCQVMDIDYFLEVTAVTSGCHGHLRIKKAVKFGTLPVDGFGYEYANAGFVGDIDGFRAPPPPPPYAPTAPPYASMPQAYSPPLQGYSQPLQAYSPTLQAYLAKPEDFSPTVPGYEPPPEPSAPTVSMKF